MNDWPLYKIVFGIRHARNFSFSGTSGAVIDSIVKNKDYYHDDFYQFKEISWTNDRMGIRLKNKEGNLFIDCNIDGYVLTYHFMEDDETSIESIKEQYKKLLKLIIPLTESRNSINRIGIIHHYAFNKECNTAKILFDNLLSVNLDGIPDSFVLRFAMKNVTSEGLVDTTKDDYTNVIYQLKSEKVDIERVSTSRYN